MPKFKLMFCSEATRLGDDKETIVYVTAPNQEAAIRKGYEYSREHGLRERYSDFFTQEVDE